MKPLEAFGTTETARSMFDVDLGRGGGEPGPPVEMGGVTYAEVVVRHPVAGTPPIAAEWRLYAVRTDGLELHASDPGTPSGALPRGSVVGMAGDSGHWFTSAGSAAPMGAPGEGWSEAPLAAGRGDPALVVGRIPQVAMPNLSLFGLVWISPDEHGAASGRLNTLIDWIVEEGRRDEPASSAVIQRLSEIIIIEFARVGASHGVLFSERPQRGEYDSRIWRAITAISREPERLWTLGEMAATAGMSRSAFAARYHEVVGMTPMRSLRRLRLHRAATVLAGSAAQKLAPLATAAGYGSDAAFCRAFAKEFGHPPKRLAQRDG